MDAERKARDLDRGYAAAAAPSAGNPLPTGDGIRGEAAVGGDSDMSTPCPPDEAGDHGPNGREEEREAEERKGSARSRAEGAGDRTNYPRHSGSVESPGENEPEPDGAVSNGKETSMRDSQGGGGGGSGGGYFDDDDMNFDIDDLENVSV